MNPWSNRQEGSSSDQLQIPLNHRQHHPYSASGVYDPILHQHNGSTTLFDTQTQYDPRTLPARLKRRPTKILHAMGRWWRRAVVVGHWPRVIYSFVGLTLLGVWVALIVHFAQHEVNYQKKNFGNIGSVNQTVNQRANSEFWYLQGSLSQFDPQSRTLTVKWSMLWSHNDSDRQSFGTEPEHTMSIAIFRDQSLIPEDQAFSASVNASNNTLAASNVGLRIDNLTATPVGVVGMHSWDSFSTDIDFGQAQTGHAWMTPNMGFPLDQWKGSIVFVASYYGLATQFNSSNSFGTWIDDAFLVDSIINWRISAKVTNSCTDEGGQWIDNNNDPCQMMIEFDAHRPSLVIFSTVIAVAVNWLSTIFIYLMTCEAVVLSRHRLLESSQLLAVCFTALFALPTVRSILPSAPPFGAMIDLVGIIPNVFIISLCTTMLAIAFLSNMVERHHSRNGTRVSIRNP